MPQGLLEKIQVQLLLADLALQLGDLPARLGQTPRPRSRPSRQGHLARLGLGRPARTFPQSRLAAVPQRITPAVENDPVDLELAAQSCRALTRRHPFKHAQLELSTELPSRCLRHAALSS